MEATIIEDKESSVYDLLLQEVKQNLKDGIPEALIVNTLLSRRVSFSDCTSLIAQAKKTNKENVVPVDVTKEFEKALNPTNSVTTVQNNTIVEDEKPAHTAHLVTNEPMFINEDSKFTEGYPKPIDEKDFPSTLTVLDRIIDVTFIKHKPDVIVFDNVLTAQECQDLIAYATDRVKPSSVVDRETGKFVPHEARTSSGASFRKGETAVLAWMEKFASELLKWPYVNSEGFQILNYKVGQFYKPHYDHFDPKTQSGQQLIKSVSGNRVATLLFYLNNVEQGGATQFPNLDLTVLPKQGRLLFFSFPDVNNAKELLHAALPPTAGEKWVAVNWFRQGKYAL